MDLTQSKLTKIEWMNAEIPVTDSEKNILKLIMDGYHNINVRTNLNQSLFQQLKVDNTPENEAFLYKKYFEKAITHMVEKYQKKIPDLPKIAAPALATKAPKKVDVIRIEHMDKTLEQKRADIFEFILLDFCTTILQAFAEQTNKHAFAFYTLLQLKKATIPHTNQYVIQYVDKIIQYARTHLSIRDVIHQAHEFIEKNPYLLKYEDMMLFQHQKQLFTIMKQDPETPKLVLYIAPTGTGKTLSLSASPKNIASYSFVWRAMWVWLWPSLRFPWAKRLRLRLVVKPPPTFAFTILRRLITPSINGPVRLAKSTTVWDTGSKS
jgi:hypothetical protein